MMFSDISSKWQWGLTARGHRFNYNVITESGTVNNNNEETIVNVFSIGTGLRYYFVNDVNSTYAFYLNPNLEVTSMEGDEGLDFSLNIGYTRALSPLLSLILEAGVRNRTFLYSNPYAEEYSFLVYVGGGIGFRIPYFGRGLNNQAKYR